MDLQTENPVQAKGSSLIGLSELLNWVVNKVIKVQSKLNVPFQNVPNTGSIKACIECEKSPKKETGIASFRFQRDSKYMKLTHVGAFQFD
ncbi:hypothetical protein DPMN_094991 [Dreissena polymorpha]|uniref:Uncharacterized protein n=1 Tax=Dreissena polymorpha TaxID=45954 RepID=A0A9D4R2B6_DREPO|nr:hypothetical protein DPMN_094991 [Dreissena polymorpha]